jgi:large subunit ribosomal protein L17
LLRHKRITTTVAKAKETRMVVEKIITRAKKALALRDAAPVASAAGAAPSERQAKFLAAGGHHRREVSRLIKDREVVSELFSTIAEKVAARPGGYTRIVKLGQRYGDGAQMAVIELVDFNAATESGKKSEKPAKKETPKKKPARKKQAGKREPARGTDVKEGSAAAAG